MTERVRLRAARNFGRHTSAKRAHSALAFVQTVLTMLIARFVLEALCNSLRFNGGKLPLLRFLRVQHGTARVHLPPSWLGNEKTHRRLTSMSFSRCPRQKPLHKNL